MHLDRNLIDSFESKQDTARFWIKTAKINNPEYLTKFVLDALRESDFKFVITRIKSENLQLINTLEDLDFRLKDVQLTYKFEINGSPICCDFFNPDIIIREATIDDIAALRIVAEDCFRDYGHYFADEKLDKESCMEVYREWTEKAVLSKDASVKFFLAEQSGIVLGYLFFGIKDLENGRYSYGGLGAVGSKNRSKNVFSTLVIKGLEWAKQENHIWQEHNVLNINYPVNRVFSKLGFYIYKSETTLHAWL